MLARTVGSARASDVRGHPDARYWFDTYTPQFERVIMPASAEQMLMAGVTTVRDLAAPPQPILPSRSASPAEKSPGPDAVCRRAGADERRKPERRPDVECLRRGRRDGEDPPVHRRRRRLDQDHQRRAVDAGGDEGDRRRGACPRPQSRGTCLQRRGDSAGLDRWRRRLPARSHPDAGIPCRHRRDDPRSGEETARRCIGP